MDEDFYISLLYKKLDGRLQAPESTQLQDWLDRSEEHRLIADSVTRAWEAGASYQRKIDVDLDAEFAQLDARILADEAAKSLAGNKRPEGVVHNLVAWRVAATIALLLTAGLLLRNYLGKIARPLQQVVTTTETTRQQLSDGSTIWVNRNSRLEYPEAYSATERRVSLEGEAFFDIARDESRPFIITTELGEVQVLGTSFNVRSIAGSNRLEVEVSSGRVRLTPRNGNQSVELTAGEQASFDLQSGRLDKAVDRSPNAAYWHHQRLVFIDAPLEMVLEDLEKSFQTSIELRNPVLADCPFTATFEQKSLQTILKTLEGVFGMTTTEISEQKIQMEGGICP